MAVLKTAIFWIMFSDFNYLLSPKISGIPSLFPTTTTLELFDLANSRVASIPFSLKILSVRDALNILLASAFPSASILTFWASFWAFWSLNSWIISVPQSLWWEYQKKYLGDEEKGGPSPFFFGRREPQRGRAGGRSRNGFACVCVFPNSCVI